MEISEGKVDKSPSKSYRGSIVALFLAFACLIALAYRAVEIANDGQDAARAEAEAAKLEVSGLQQQLNCTIQILSLATTGVVDNAIVQNDVLLISAEAGDRAAVIQQLKETRARLVSISGEVKKANEECTR